MSPRTRNVTRNVREMWQNPGTGGPYVLHCILYTRGLAAPERRTKRPGGTSFTAVPQSPAGGGKMQWALDSVLGHVQPRRLPIAGGRRRTAARAFSGLRTTQRPLKSSLTLAPAAAAALSALSGRTRRCRGVGPGPAPRAPHATQRCWGALRSPGGSLRDTGAGAQAAGTDNRRSHGANTCAAALERPWKTEDARLVLADGCAAPPPGLPSFLDVGAMRCPPRRGTQPRAFMRCRKLAPAPESPGGHWLSSWRHMCRGRPPAGPLRVSRRPCQFLQAANIGAGTRPPPPRTRPRAQDHLLGSGVWG